MPLQHHSLWKQKALPHSVLNTHTDAAGAHTYTKTVTYNTCCIRTAWTSASRLPFSLSLHLLLWHWETFVQVDDDKPMLLLLEISHPALFTDRCHGIMATLNCQHLVKRIEAWWRFYLSCLCSSCWPIRDTVESNK